MTHLDEVRELFTKLGIRLPYWVSWTPDNHGFDNRIGIDLYRSGKAEVGYDEVGLCICCAVAAQWLAKNHGFTLDRGADFSEDIWRILREVAAQSAAGTGAR